MIKRVSWRGRFRAFTTVPEVDARCTGSRSCFLAVHCGSRGAAELSGS